MGTQLILPDGHYEFTHVENNTEFPPGTLRLSSNGKKFRWYNHGKLYEFVSARSGGIDEEAAACIESYPTVVGRGEKEQHCDLGASDNHTNINGRGEIIDDMGSMVGSVVGQPDVVGYSNDVLGIAADTAFLASGGDGDVTTTADNIAAPTIDELVINDIVENTY